MAAFLTNRGTSLRHLFSAFIFIQCVGVTILVFKTYKPLNLRVTHTGQNDDSSGGAITAFNVNRPFFPVRIKYIPRQTIPPIPSREVFLLVYNRDCEKTTKVTPHGLCPCIPPKLAGKLRPALFTNITMETIQRNNPKVQSGGVFNPSECTARQRVAIIVPYRDRMNHLLLFLNHIHPILQRQQLNYTIIVVEQKYPKVFNKAAMMNIGAIEAMKTYPALDCLIFHDVDLLAEDDRNFYTCSENPRHVTPYLKKWHYKFQEWAPFGGGTAFSVKTFKAVNGFSNSYSGWGGEDDDMFRRVYANGYVVTRYPYAVARFTNILHERDGGNPENKNATKALQFRPDLYFSDGIKKIKYKLRSVTLQPLYMWITADFLG